MSPQVSHSEQICVECSLCSFYWGNSCPGLRKFTRDACADIES